MYIRPGSGEVLVPKHREGAGVGASVPHHGVVYDQDACDELAWHLHSHANTGNTFEKVLKFFSRKDLYLFFIFGLPDSFLCLQIYKKSVFFPGHICDLLYSGISYEVTSDEQILANKEKMINFRRLYSMMDSWETLNRYDGLMVTIFDKRL